MGDPIGDVANVLPGQTRGIAPKKSSLNPQPPTSYLSSLHGILFTMQRSFQVPFQPSQKEFLAKGDDTGKRIDLYPLPTVHQR